MQDYFEAKFKIIEYSRNKKLIVSRKQQELIGKLEGRAEIVSTIDLSTTDLNVPAYLKEGFSLSNLEMALTCLSHLSKVDQGINLENLDSPPGRFEIIEKENVIFIVDYAHTPDALEKALEQARMLYPGLLIVTVFGCGGDRDRSKRPLMLSSALDRSHKVIVTSDNPRTENPEDIIKDIVKGNKDILSYIERRKAIEESYKLAKSLSGKEKSIVMIAGKGDENYQEIHGVRHEFSDSQVIKGL